MSNTTSTGPRGVYAPSRATDRLRALAVAAVAALAATTITLAVVDPSPEVAPLPAEDLRSDPASAGTSVHDSGIERVLQDRGAGASATSGTAHDSEIEKILRERGDGR